MKQLEAGYKKIINWNRYQSKPTDQEQYRYFEYLIDPSFQGVNRFFVLSLENRTDRKLHTGYYIPKVEIKDHNFITDERNFFDRPIKSDLKTYNNIRKIATGQGDDYTTGCLLHYLYFKEHFELIAIDLSKQQKLDADPKAMQQINFTGNLEKNATIFFIIGKRKKQF